MESIFLLFAYLVLMLMSALVTTYIAQGRPFWRWFLLGMVLPYVSVFVAMMVVYREQLAEDALSHE